MATAPRTPLLAGLAVAGLVVLAAVFYGDLLITRIAVARLGPAAILAAATALACAGIGRTARTLLEQRVFPEWVAARPRLRYDFLIGYPLFGLVAFLAGLVSTGPIVQGMVLVGCMALGVLGAGDYRFSGAPEREPTALATLSLLFAGVALLLAFVHAQAPPFTLDEVAYHLAVPRQWVIEGRAIEFPLLSHSYFPLGIESADLPSLAILGADGAIASHLLHLLAAIAGFAVLAGAVSGTVSLPVALALATTPALFFTAGWSWNEWPLAGITLVAVLAGASVAGRDEEGAGPAVFGIALGAGALTKYTFIPVAAILLATLGLMLRRDPARRGMVLRAALVAALSGSAFLVRNLVLTGNATAPFLEPHAPAVQGFRLAGSLAETARSYLFDPGLIDEALGVALPALAIAALLLFALHDRYSRLVAAGFAGVVVALLAAAPSSRILVPSLLVLAVIGARALAASVEGRRSAATALSVLLLSVTALHLHLAIFYTERLGAGGVLAGLTDPQAFVELQRRDARAIAAIDALLPEESRTLVIGTSELFWFSRPVRGGGNFDGPRIAAWLRAPDLPGRLRADGITHVAVFRGGLSRAAAPLDPKEEERVTRLDSAAALALDALLRDHATPAGGFADAELFALRWGT
ncbi:MAG TPA: hypothetical protein VMS56_04990 [Thermoanaerobaculia bacterium]|nr:hypothetical protein [Thermoanaerobaculia bacterium]